MFPAFDAGEENQSKFLRCTGRLGCAIHGDLSQKCGVLRAAWGVLLGCYTGLEKVCFAFEHNGTTSSEHSYGVTTTAQLNVPGNQKARSILAGSLSTLLSMPQSKAKTLCNTALCICSFANEPSNDDQNQRKRQDSFSWCKICMFVDPATLHTVLWWDPGFSKYRTVPYKLLRSSCFEVFQIVSLQHPIRSLTHSSDPRTGEERQQHIRQDRR